MTNISHYVRWKTFRELSVPMSIIQPKYVALATLDIVSSSFLQKVVQTCECEIALNHPKLIKSEVIDGIFVKINANRYEYSE